MDGVARAVAVPDFVGVRVPVGVAPTDNVAVEDLDGVNVGEAVILGLAVMDPEIVVVIVGEVDTVAVIVLVPVAVPVEEAVIVVEAVPV